MHGSLRWIDDPIWLRRNLEEFTNQHEADRQDAWQVDDAPAEFTQAMSDQIAGVEVRVVRIEGRWKFSQHERASNRLGVISELVATADLAGQRLAATMSKLETGLSEA